MEPLPRAVIRLARGHAGLVLLGVLVAIVSAIAMRVGTDLQTHARMLALHGGATAWIVVAPAVFGMLASLVVPEAMRASSVPTIRLAALGLVLWATGAIVLVTIAATSDGWTLYAPQSSRTSEWVPPALVAMGMLLVFVHLARTFVAGLRGATPLAIVVVLGILGPLAWQCFGIAQAIATYLRDPFVPIEPSLVQQFEDSMHVHVIAALAILTHLSSRALATSEVWPRRAAVGLAGVAAWYIVTGHWVTTSIGLGAIITIVALWLFASVRSRGWADPLTLAIATGVAPAMIVLGVSRWVLAREQVDIHLHDTWFVVGTLHAGGTIVALTWLAGVIVWSKELLGRTPRAWPARIGVVLLGLGGVAHAITMLLLGSAGMPRRYAMWVDELDALQQVTTIAGHVPTIGVVLVLAAIAAGRRDTAAPH